MATASPIVATRLHAAIAHRTWSIAGAGCCHLFLLRSGRAVLSRPPLPPSEIGAPAMLWLPPSASGTLQVMAGGDGFTAAIGVAFVQRVVGDAAVTAPMRPLLDQIVIGGPDALAARMPALAASFEALVEESQQLQPGATAMIGLHLSLLLVQLWRATGLHRAAGPRGAGAGTAQRFRQLVELHYREALRIDDFAGRLGVTRAHLHDACLRADGRTPLALLHDRLMTEARSRLEQTDLSVEQVGYGLGFRDPGYFNRFFKRLSGQSPGAYRRSATAARSPAAAASFAAWP